MPNSTETRADGRLSYLPALALLLAGAIFLTALSLRAPSSNGQFALFYSPGTTRTEAIAALAGLKARFVRPGQFDNILVAAFETPVSGADLRANGIWFAFDPLAFGGCLVADAAIPLSPFGANS